MTYRYLGDIAIADVAFEAEGPTVNELFAEAGDALVNVMVGDPGSISPEEKRPFHIEAGSLDRLLFEFLQLFIFYKDAERLLLRARNVSIAGGEGAFTLRAEASGEQINPHRHELGADVKAVTLHRFRIWEETGVWKATVVLDI